MVLLLCSSLRETTMALFIWLGGLGYKDGLAVVAGLMAAGPVGMVQSQR